MDNNKETYLRKLHSDILVVMDEIDRLCTKYHLRYYLIGGTLLGAIRHQGFIPWDDDLDIVMPRDDYEKFIQLCMDGHLNDNFYLEWITTNEKYPLFFAKVCLYKTTFDEGNFCKINPFGIFVDIFPLDYCGGYSAFVEKTKNKVVKLIAVAGSKVINDDFQLKHWPRRILRHFLSSETIHNYTLKLATQLSREGHGYYTNLGSQYSPKKQTMPIEWFGEGVKLPFEDRKYQCPTEYKKVVESIFGPKYMDIPPIEKRRTHYPRKVKFTDGEVMEFQPPKKKLTIYDQ